jgi:hypothetical protein
MRKRTPGRQRDYTGNIDILNNTFDNLDAFESYKGRSLSPVRFIHYQSTLENVNYSLPIEFFYRKDRSTQDTPIMA